MTYGGFKKAPTFKGEDMARATMKEVPVETVETAETTAAESAVKKKLDKYGFSGETTTITLFYDGLKYKDPLFVQINGRSFLIKRGEPVTVPVEVAAVVNQSLMQDGHAAQLIRGLTSKPQDMGQM